MRKGTRATENRGPTKAELLNETLLRPREAAAYLNISLKTMRKLLIARVYVTDRTFRYRPEDLERWVKGHSD
jgi:hypothetical protein